MGIFRRIKLKIMTRKVRKAMENAEDVIKSAEDAWRWVDIFKAEHEGTQRELNLIPWYRPFKRRRMRRYLRWEIDRLNQTIEEAKRKGNEARQARKRAKDMKDLEEVEFISQRLSERPDDIEIIHQWLSNPPRQFCYEASRLKENKRLIPKTKGVYAWYFAHGKLNVPANPYFRVDDFELVYVGIAGKKPESKGSLRDRIYNQHINGNAEGSTLRFSLGILLRRKGSLLELKRKGIIKKHIEWSNEDDLTEWICDNALVAWIEHKRPWIVEESAVKNLGHLLPLNIEHNKGNSFAQELNRERKSLKNEAGA